MLFSPETRVSAESSAARNAVLKNLSAVFPAIQTKYHYVPSSPAPSPGKPLTIFLRPEPGAASRSSYLPVIIIRLTGESGVTKADLTAKPGLWVRGISGFIYGCCLLMLVIAAASEKPVLLALACFAALALRLINSAGFTVHFRYARADRILDVLKTAVESA